MMISWWDDDDDDVLYIVGKKRADLQIISSPTATQRGSANFPDDCVTKANSTCSREI